MECPFCGKIDTGVIDSRPTKEGGIRRRRKCLACAGRFTTYEATTEQLLFLLMKRHAGKGASLKSSEAVLSFMSSALRGLSDDLERLRGQVDKPETSEEARKPRRKLAVKPKRKKKPAAKKKIVKPTAKKAKPKKVKPKRAKKLTDTAQVLKVVKGHKKGVDIAKLKKRTGFAEAKLRAIVHRAYKEGKVKRIGRGIYVSA
jgi:hypothetical protein